MLIELVDVYRSACAPHKGDQFCVPHGLPVKSFLEDFLQPLDGAFKPQLAQQSDVLARKGGARAAAQQQGEETQLKSKNNGGESISGLGLPDVVRELLRDPAILQWRPHEEVYEVMDGEKFEDR